MYLHIGKNYMINSKNIIGIFDIISLKKTKNYDNLLNGIKTVEDISDKKEKSLILTIENNKQKAYISNIISTTISKRSNW